jgi:hypothetical protein
LFLLLLLGGQGLPAQDLILSRGGWGFNAGLHLAFGTHVQRLGASCQLYYVHDFVQANTELRAYFNFRNLGPERRYPELALSQGLVIGYGGRQSWYNPFLSPVSNQTGYLHALGYAYSVWLNPVRTSQQTGVIALQFGRLSLIAENDLLARRSLDRFRTGAFLLQYQHRDLFQAALNCSMWTGKMGTKRSSSRPEFRHGCYMDTTGGVYADRSHGLLTAQLKYHPGYSQVLQLNAGIDAEQVRNLVQNKLMHDLYFIPKVWQKTRNCHIPMLDQQGQPYLYEPGQEIRAPRLYLNAFTNPGLFY